MENELNWFYFYKEPQQWISNLTTIELLTHSSCKYLALNKTHNGFSIAYLVVSNSTRYTLNVISRRDNKAHYMCWREWSHSYYSLWNESHGFVFSYLFGVLSICRCSVVKEDSTCCASTHNTDLICLISMKGKRLSFIPSSSYLVTVVWMMSSPECMER